MIRKLGHFFSLSIKVVDTKYFYLLSTLLANQTPIESFVYSLGRFSQDGRGHQVVSPTFYGLALCRFLIRKLGHFFSLSIKVVDTKYLCILYIKLENQSPMDRYKISGQTLLFQDIPGQKRSKKLSIKI